MRLTHAEFTATQDKIAKLNKRAAKRGWTGRVTITGEEIEITETGPSGLPVTKQFVETTISGDAPSYDGWTFLARVEYDRDSGMVIFSAPGVDAIDRSNLRPEACDHCGINRYRKHVYIVRNDETGNEIQVGSTCLKDFLGWNTRPVWISEPSESDLFEGGYGHIEPTYSTETVLAAAWAAIQTFGYVRASDYSGEPTKYTVAAILDPRNDKDRELARKIRPLVDQATNSAKLIRAWILSDEFKGSSDYVYNLKGIAGREFTRFRNFGFLVSAPQAWAKAQERTLIRQREQGDVLNEWNGQPGDKLELAVTLKSIRFIESYYGTSSLYTFAGSDKRIYTWFSSRCVFTEAADVGREMKIRGTVKAHKEYKGMKQTQLTRCKVI